MPFAETHIWCVGVLVREPVVGVGVVATNPYFQRVEFVVLLPMVLFLDGAREKMFDDVF